MFLTNFFPNCSYLKKSYYLATAIESIPSGGGIDTSWWYVGFFKNYNTDSIRFCNDTYVITPYLAKASGDYISVSLSSNQANYSPHGLLDRNLTLSNVCDSRILCKVYRADYTPSDYWGSASDRLFKDGGYPIGGVYFRINTSKSYIPYIRIKNETTGLVYFQGELYEEGTDTLDKSFLIRTILYEKSANTIINISASNYNQLATDADVVSALSSNPKVSLASI